MKKLLFGILVVLLVLFVLGTFGSGDDLKDVDISGTIITNEGKNLVSSNLLSDPSVVYEGSMSGTQANLTCKFPGSWEYADENTRLGSKDGNFEMWFTSVTDNKLVLSRAESKNGIVWSNIIEGIVGPSENGWDKIGVETASVLKDPGGKYRMYYSSSFKDNDDFAIGLALSDEGISWEKYSSKPVFEERNDWEVGDASGVAEPSVIYDKEDSLYKMWYNGLGEKDGKLAFRIGYATSRDGIEWNRNSEPVLDIGKEGEWDDVLVSHQNVVKANNGYHMFYFGVEDWCEGCTMQKGALGHAYSVDGISWQKNPNNPILEPRDGKWDAWTIGGPSAIVSDNEIWLYYFGNPSKDSFHGRIGLVVGEC